MAGRSGDRWVARPALAWSVRVAVVLVPLLASLVVAVLVVALLPRPTTVLADLGWWAAVLGAALVAAQLVERVARRALPLAALLTLSLVFPDRAPSRLRTARSTSLRELERQVARLEDVGEPAEAARGLVALVGALGMHDKRTRGHSERVRAYVDLITEEMGLPEPDRVRLRWAALIHDVGKLTVPGSVLNGGRDLAEDDWHALREHPAAGERLASGLLPWLGEWGLCVREHHERWDGHGYPQGLAGAEISRGARIVAVADAFEVMTANRSYQKAITAAAARAELSRCAGTDFDPAVVRAFLQVSIGRMRGVLGPFAFLPAVPLAVMSDRAGHVVRGATTLGAVTLVALGVAASPSAHPVAPRTPTRIGGGTPVVLPTPAPTLAPGAAPTLVRPAPLAVRRPGPETFPVPATAPTPTPTAGPVPPPAPAVSPTAVPVLYLTAGGGLTEQPPVGGSVVIRVDGSVAVFSDPVRAEVWLQGTPVVTLVVQLQTWHGRGHPRSSVVVTLQDCVHGVCRALTGGTALVPQRVGHERVLVRMAPQSTVVAAGHELRLAVSTSGATNVRALTLLCGSSALRLV